MKSIFLAVVLSIYFIYSYKNINFYPEDLALGKENTHVTDYFKGNRINGSNIDDIKSLYNQHFLCGNFDKKIIWLGNSQLHTINHYENNQHVSPYWLNFYLKDIKCLTVLGLSLPNANLKEFLLITQYSISKANLDTVIISMVFDDFREGGPRKDFEKILDADFEKNVRMPFLNKLDKKIQISKKFDQDAKNSELISSKFVNSIYVPIKNVRENLKAHLMNDLYNLRNFVFHITPSTIRKKIPVNYNENMVAFKETLELLDRQNIKTIIYIAPIRQDLPLPYDLVDYVKWKNEIALFSNQHKNTIVLNLEELIPNEEWGLHASHVDFMHFKAEAHKILALKLYETYLMKR